MAIIPWSYLNSSDSPFVTVFELAGIKWAAALINFVVLTSAASALNSTLYSTGRHLYQIAHDSPNSFLKAIKADTLSRHNVPQMPSSLQQSWLLCCLYQCFARCFRCLCFDYSVFIRCLHRDLYLDHGGSSQIPQVTRLHGGWLPHAPLPFSKSFNHALLYLCLCNPFLQESTFMGAIGSAIWIVVSEFIVSGNLENNSWTHQLCLVSFF